MDILADSQDAPGSKEVPIDQSKTSQTVESDANAILKQNLLMEQENYKLQKEILLAEKQKSLAEAEKAKIELEMAQFNADTNRQLKSMEIEAKSLEFEALTTRRRKLIFFAFFFLIPQKKITISFASRFKIENKSENKMKNCH